MERIIDLTSADNGRYKTQIAWINSFNREGKAMISPLDVYRAPDSLLSSFREDFNKGGLVTGTRIAYNPNDLTARIIYNFGSTVVKPTEKSLVVPVYREKQIEKVAKGEGLKYLQALFHTEDDASKLIGRLEEISNKEAKNIIFWTLNQSSRIGYAERVVAFFYGKVGRFHVDGLDWFGNYGVGRSRGASVKPVSKK